MRRAARITADSFTSLAADLNRSAAAAAPPVQLRLSRNRQLLDTIYTTSWVAARIIDIFAEDMTRDGVEFKGMEEPQAERLQRYATRCGLWLSIADTVRWARLYGGACCYVHVSGQDPATPLDPRTVAARQFGGFHVYDRYRALPAPGRNPGTAAEPEYYQLGEDFPCVHRSRLLTVTGVPLPYYRRLEEQHWGDSVLERIWPRVMAREKLYNHTLNMVNRGWLRTVKINGLRNILAAGGKAQENLTHMFSLMRDVQDSSGLTLMDNSDTFQTDSFSYAGLKDLLDAFNSDLAGAADVPQTRLYGISPSGFSTGDSELQIYYEKIASAQEAQLREPLTAIFTVLYMSCFGELPPPGFDFSFISPDRPSAAEERAASEADARLIIDAANAGLLPPDKAMAALRQQGGLFSGISDEDIAQAALAMPPDPVPGDPDAPQGGEIQQ